MGVAIGAWSTAEIEALAWSRPQRGGGARARARKRRQNGTMVARTEDELKGSEPVSSITLKRLLRSPFSDEPQDNVK